MNAAAQARQRFDVPAEVLERLAGEVEPERAVEIVQSDAEPRDTVGLSPTTRGVPERP